MWTSQCVLVREKLFGNPLNPFKSVLTVTNYNQLLILLIIINKFDKYVKWVGLNF